MTAHGKTARPEMLAAEALKIMEDHIEAVVVVDDQDRPVGALNMHDLRMRRSDVRNQDLQQRAKAIKLAIFDVDGVLTDGRLYFHRRQRI